MYLHFVILNKKAKLWLWSVFLKVERPQVFHSKLLDIFVTINWHWKINFYFSLRKFIALFTCVNLFFQISAMVRLLSTPCRTRSDGMHSIVSTSETFKWTLMTHTSSCVISTRSVGQLERENAPLKIEWCSLRWCVFSDNWRTDCACR